LLPGERGANRAQDQQKNGISLTAGTAKRLVKLAKTVGVDVPVALG
jgi:LDH2 family malate/lactate/ureidoglycolate dehydrogenase